MTGRRKRHVVTGSVVLAMCASLLAVGCGGDSPQGTVFLSMDVRGPVAGIADPGTPVVDERGISSLDVYPVFVMVTVEADDTEGPVVETWPDRVPAEGPLQVRLELTVPAGPGRRVLVTLLLAEEEQPVATLASPGPGDEAVTVDVVAGDVVEVEPSLAELSRGTLRATIEESASAISLAWVDDRAGAAFPAAELLEGSVDVEAAVGRTYWPRLALAGGETVDLPEQSHRLGVEGEILEVDIDAH